MARLRRTSEWRRPEAIRAERRSSGFTVARPAAASRTAMVWTEDLRSMVRRSHRRDLGAVVADLHRRGYQPDVHLLGVRRGDDLVLAAIVALFLELRVPGTTVSVYADRHGLRSELYELFRRAMPKPGALLEALDRATLARMHYLVGQRDDDGVDRFAPLLPFIDAIADGDRDLARQLARRLDIDKRNLQLMVTRRCQLRCVYCPADKRDEDLDIEQALSAIDLLLASDAETIRVDFAGGEPLLRKAWMRRLIETCHERARRRGKRDSYYLVTNAIELDDDFCRFLAGLDVELEISIDGDEATHNGNTRSVVAGLNPYRALLRGFEHVRRHDLDYNAVLVFTPETFPQLPRNLEHVRRLGFGNVALNYAIGYRWDPAVIERYVGLLAELVEQHDVLDRGEQAPLLIKNLRHKSEPTVLNSELMVDTDGSLHLLSEWQFNKALRRRSPSLKLCRADLESIDDVFFTKAQIYHLLHEVYRSPTSNAMELVHNSVETGFQVARQLRERLGGALR